MIIDMDLENLTLLPGTEISFGIKKIIKNPLVTIVLTRKEIKGSYKFVYSLEKEIFNLPKEKAKLLKPEKRGLLTRTGKRIDRMEKKILEEITEKHKLKANVGYDRVTLTVELPQIGEKRAEIRKEHAKKFFKFN